MTVSQLAKLLNVSPDTVRHYVRCGLLTPKRSADNGYNQFTQDDEKRLRFILQAKDLGFSLKDIATIIEQSQNGESPCPQVREMMAQRLKETEAKIQAMQQTYDKMLSAVKHWQHQEDCIPTGQHICHLIEGFSENQTQDCCHE